MKRALGLLLIIIACLVGFLSIWGYMPVVPNFDSSMEPVIQLGSLITIKSVAAKEIEVGDIIVYGVPSLKREQYNYPVVVAHRVIEVKKENSSLSFRTKGDNTDEDPFYVRPVDIKGAFNHEIPCLGFPLFLFKSWQGSILVVIAILILAICLYSKELSLGSQRFYRTLLNPVIQEYYQANLILSHRFEATEAVLDKFAHSMELYSQHLESHTSAIQGLSGASNELKKSAAEHNRIIAYMMKTIEHRTYGEEVSRVEKITRELERKTLEVANTKDELEKAVKMRELKVETEALQFVGTKSPSGCALSHKVVISRKYIHN
jgi:signal peptidase I